MKTPTLYIQTRYRESLHQETETSKYTWPTVVNLVSNALDTDPIPLIESDSLGNLRVRFPLAQGGFKEVILPRDIAPEFHQAVLDRLGVSTLREKAIGFLWLQMRPLFDAESREVA